MKIAIIGTGRVAAALGQRWAGRGHMVTFASRQPGSEKVAGLVEAAGANAAAARVADAVARSSTVVLAVPFSAVRDILAQAGDLSGKVLIDCTNPIAPGLRPLFDSATSGAEQIAGWTAGARVVKAFNTTGAENMAAPGYAGGAATMLLCGDDELAKAAVWHWPRKWVSSRWTPARCRPPAIWRTWPCYGFTWRRSTGWGGGLRSG